MKKGIGTLCFTPGMKLKEIFVQAKKYGFDGVELWLGLEGEVRVDMTDAEIAQIKKDATEAGIELYSLATLLGWSVSLTSNDENERETAKKYIKRQIEIAAGLGCINSFSEESYH